MIAKDLVARVRKRARHRCEYCQSPQKYVFGRLEIDHIIPRTAGGTDEETNLGLACRMCNGFKGTQTTALDPISAKLVKLFNPRRQRWLRHFAWCDEGTQIWGRTACGRATVIALRLNNQIAMMVRTEWVAAGWHPPQR